MFAQFLEATNVPEIAAALRHGKQRRRQVAYQAMMNQMRQRELDGVPAVVAGNVGALGDMTQADLRQQLLEVLHTSRFFQGDPTHAGRPATQ